MAYNLNYNPGVEYHKELKHRKVWVVLVVTLTIIALIILIAVGLWNTFKPKDQDHEGLTIEEKNRIIEEISRGPTATEEEKKKVLNEFEEEKNNQTEEEKNEIIRSINN